SVPVYRSDLVNCHQALGSLLGNQVRREEAAEEHRQALALGRQLVGDFPTNPTYALDFGGCCCNYGNLLSAGGKHADSLEWYRQAIETLGPLAQKQPQLATARRFLRN